MSVGSEVQVGRAKRSDSVLSREDCLCPVCLDIYIEPVTLPCKHTFCKSCFLESVDKSTLCCPLCRKRISTWVRLHSKNHTLVDKELWDRVQTCFPLQCQRRLAGQDAEDDAHPVLSGFPRVSNPGELRQEYEDQVIKLQEERRVQDEEERMASEELIQRMLAEEETLLQEERRRKYDDEQLARHLSTQLNSGAELRVPEVTPAKKKEVAVGSIDRFLCPRVTQPNSTSNTENILLLEAEFHMERPLPQTGGSQLIRPSSVKRKSSELEMTGEEEVTIKRVQVFSSSLEAGLSAEWEAELQLRKQQEEEDRRLAVLLQKELDEKERRRATDRRKGSFDAYMLRPQRGGTGETGPSSTTGRGSCTTPMTSDSSSSTPCSSLSLKVLKTLSSSSSSSSPSGRGRKQTTLTRMFAPSSSSSTSSSFSSSSSSSSAADS